MQSQIILIGDRVLIRPDETEEQKWSSGLYVPATAQHSDPLVQGTIVQTGPGYLTGVREKESWSPTDVAPVNHVPLQARAGDHAYFLRSHSVEVTLDGTRYAIVPHHAIQMVLRGALPG